MDSTGWNDQELCVYRTHLCACRWLFAPLASQLPGMWFHSHRVVQVSSDSLRLPAAVFTSRGEQFNCRGSCHGVASNARTVSHGGMTAGQRTHTPVLPVCMGNRLPRCLHALCCWSHCIPCRCSVPWPPCAGRGHCAHLLRLHATLDHLRLRRRGWHTGPAGRPRTPTRG